MTRPLRFLLFTLLAVLVGGLLGYAAPPNLARSAAPRIVSFKAASPSLTSGDKVRLSWRLGGGKPDTVRLISAFGMLSPQGNSITLNPKISATYTLVVENRQGSDQKNVSVEVSKRVTQTPRAAVRNTNSGGALTTSAVSGGAVSATSASAASLPEGTFGVSLEPAGPFLSDEASGIRNPNDKRIIRVAPGGSFFAEVNYHDPDGIAEIELLLVNSSPEGLSGQLSPARAPFTWVGPPQGDCKLEQLSTAVRCVYRVTVAKTAQNIDKLPGAGDEFAYVFRVKVEDGAKNAVRQPRRGYVVVTPR